MWLPLNEKTVGPFPPPGRVFFFNDPGLRSQEKAVEYTRALNAAKLEKVRHFFLPLNSCFVLLLLCCK